MKATYFVTQWIQEMEDAIFLDSFDSLELALAFMASFFRKYSGAELYLHEQESVC
jgi:hypothetical protein